MATLQTSSGGAEGYHTTRSQKRRCNLLYASAFTSTRSFSPRELKFLPTTSGGDGCSGSFYRATATMTGGNAITTGSVIEVVARLKVATFTGLNANQLACFAIKGAGGVGLYNTTATTDSIRVGVASNGKVFLVTGSGAAVQSTDTGITVTTAVAFTIRVVWTVGTNVLLYVDDVLGATNATTIPAATNSDAWFIGAGTSTTTAPTIAFQWGTWSIEEP